MNLNLNWVNDVNLNIIINLFVGRVISSEKSDLENERMTLFESVIKNQRTMKELESNLLHRLTSSQVLYQIIIKT